MGIAKQIANNNKFNLRVYQSSPQLFRFFHAQLVNYLYVKLSLLTKTKRVMAAKTTLNITHQIVMGTTFTTLLA